MVLRLRLDSPMSSAVEIPVGATRSLQEGTKSVSVTSRTELCSRLRRSDSPVVLRGRVVWRLEPIRHRIAHDPRHRELHDPGVWAIKESQYLDVYRSESSCGGDSHLTESH